METLKQLLDVFEGKKTHIVSIVVTGLAIYLYQTAQITVQELIALLGLAGIGSGLHAQSARLGRRK